MLNDIGGFVMRYDGPDEELTDLIAQRLEQVDFIARAMTPAQLGGTGPADEILRAFRNSYIPGRNTPYPLWTQEVIYGIVGADHPANWGIQVEYVENAQFWTARSTHGSSYSYDREVPIIFMGPGVKPGIDTGPARTIDVAPTLARLGRISIPSSVDGRELIEPWVVSSKVYTGSETPIKWVMMLHSQGHPIGPLSRIGDSNRPAAHVPALVL